MRRTLVCKIEWLDEAFAATMLQTAQAVYVLNRTAVLSAAPIARAAGPVSEGRCSPTRIEAVRCFPELRQCKFRDFRLHQLIVAVDGVNGVSGAP
jgi:hypothetical protein